MSSGGMDWAYRLLGAGGVDPLGAAVVLHLGWRDAPNQRTDKGIARALGQHVSSVRKATAKLCAAGHIVRRSGQWVATETVAIVEQWSSARRPDPQHSDDVAPLSGTGHSVAPPVPLSGTAKCHSVAPKRKEKIEKAGAQPSRLSRRGAFVPSQPSPDLAQAVIGLNSWELSRVRQGADILLPALGLVKGGSALSDALRHALGQAGPVQ